MIKLPKILIDKKKLEERILEMAVEINAFYREEPLLVLGASRGAFIFTADLVRKISWQYEVDFLQKIESENAETYSLLGNRNLKNYHILVVNEVIVTGESCEKICHYLETQEPKSINICTLIDKKDRRTTDIKAKWKGFTMENEWVVGYGLDQDEKYRNLPYIGCLENS